VNEGITNRVGSIPVKLNTLRQRVVRAGGWNLAGYGLGQVIRFASNLVMTRLLVPDMFGVMAVAQVFMIGVAMFSDLGLVKNVIQSRRGDEPLFLNTVWVVQILRGALLWALALLFGLSLHLAGSAGWLPASTAYADPRLPAVILVLSFNVLIAGFESTKVSVAKRHLSFAAITKIELASQVVAFAGMLLWASVDRSIWALVAGGIVSSIVRVVLSFGALPGPANQWQWEGPAFREVLRFGKWTFVSSIVGFLATSGDRLLLGGLVSSLELGVYAIAFLILSAGQNALMRLLGQVAFPALSEVARLSPERLREIYYRLRLAVDCIALSASGFIFVAGSRIVGILFDARYAGAGPILEVLALILVSARYEVAHQCYFALGRPKLATIVALTYAGTLYLTVPVAFHLFGLLGAVWAIALAFAPSVPVDLWLTFKLGLLDARKELLTLPIFLLGAGAGEAFLLVAS
jgi:O-antigen/teichoic acid export membrane protein